MDGLARSILDPRTYARILYLVLALPLGIAELVFLVTAISFGFGTAITLIGIPVLVATMYAWRWMAELERGLIGRLTGVSIPSPYRPDPAGARWWRRVTARLSDPATWKDLAFLVLQLPLGTVAFTVAVTVLGTGLGALLAPAWAWAVDDAELIAVIDVDNLAAAILVVPLGALILFFGIPALGGVGRL